MVKRLAPNAISLCYFVSHTKKDGIRRKGGRKLQLVGSFVTKEPIWRAAKCCYAAQLYCEGYRTESLLFLENQEEKKLAHHSLPAEIGRSRGCPSSCFLQVSYSLVFQKDYKVFFNTEISCDASPCLKGWTQRHQNRAMCLCMGRNKKWLQVFWSFTKWNISHAFSQPSLPIYSQTILLYFFTYSLFIICRLEIQQIVLCCAFPLICSSSLNYKILGRKDTISTAILYLVDSILNEIWQTYLLN